MFTGTIEKNLVAIDGRDNRTAEVIGKNSKYKTVTVKYEDGEEKSITYATFRKHFSEVDVEEPDIEAPTEEVVEAETQIVEEVNLTEEIEEAEEDTEEPEKAKRTRSKTKKSFEELLALLPVKANLIFTRMSNGSVAVKCGKKRIFRFDSAGDNKYKFVADRCENLIGIDNVIVHEKKNGKRYVEIRKFTPSHTSPSFARNS